MEQFFVILVVAVFGLLNWLAKQSASKTPPASRPKPLAPRPQGPPREQTEDEAMRKFFEALGIPQTPVPPPRNTPRPAAATQPRNPTLGRPVVAKAPPPIQPQAAPPRPQAPAAPAPPAPLAPVALPGAISDAYWQKSPSGAPSDPSDAAANIRSLLASPASIRSAVILREVLGPPLSMQA